MHATKLGSDFWLYIIKLLFVSVLVYFLFRFFLPLLLPFLFAYLIIYLLTPVMDFAKKRLNLPAFLADYGTLLLSMSGIVALFSLILWKITGQLRLLFSNFPVYKQLLSEVCQKRFHTICKCMDSYLGLDMGTTTSFLSEQFQGLENKYHLLLSEKAGKTILSCLSSSIRVFGFFGFFAVAMFILVKEMKPLRKNISKSKHYPSLHLIYNRMKKSGFTYLKTEFLILVLNWILCSFGIFLLHNPYFFLIGAVIALFDALPIVGSGLFLIPWSIFSILQSDYYSAAVLFITFLVTLFVREILEARLLGKGMGINPFLMLLSIYIGIHLFGAVGIFLGPLGTVLIQTFMAEEPDSPQANPCD